MQCLLGHLKPFVEAQQVSMGHRLETGQKRATHNSKDLKINLFINPLMHQPPPIFYLWWRKQGPESVATFHMLEDSPLPISLSAQKVVQDFAIEWAKTLFNF